MAKQLNEEAILNELHGESAFFRASPSPQQEMSSQLVKVENKKKTRVSPRTKKTVVESQTDSVDENSTRPAGKSTGQPADQQILQTASQPDRTQGSSSARQPKNEPAGRTDFGNFDMSPILPRDKSFYITEKQDEDLNILVQKLSERLKGRIEQKIDRSTVTRLIFESTELTNDATVARLANLLTNRLASQLAGYQSD